jgi:anaerobic magnesium-protoporphyrin IX monomethyl ester cyclase
MKILFVIYELDFADHIAISYLSSIAKARGHETYLCILKDHDLSNIVENVRPDIIAYSANIYGFDELVEAHKFSKRKYSFISIMGGPHPTFNPDTFLHSEVDAYCVGEGEFAFRDFLERIEKSEPFDDVLNLITRKSSNPVRPLIKNLDDLPLPDRDLSLSNSFLKDTAKKTFYTTRGCPFKCNYCCNNYYRQLYKGKGPLVRRFSAERIIQEIEYVKNRYRTEFIKFGDDLFALNADDWLEEFSEKYRKRVSLPFNCYLRLDTVTEELLKLIKKAGCYSVHLSVDSMSELVREEILGRQMRKVDIAEQLKMIRSFGINTWVNYMLAAPKSTLEDDINTIELSREADVTYASYSTTVPMNGTKLYDYCVENDLIDLVSHRSDMTGCYEQSTLKCFSERERAVRYNIYLLGAIIAKLPNPFFRLALQMIKVIPPNHIFKKLRSIFYLYSIENKIFKLHA